jgi:erythromycin esterase
MPSTDESTRRRFLALTGTGVAALAGCANRTDTAPSRSATATAPGTPTGTSAPGAANPPVDAIERVAVPVELTADSPGLDTVAARLATSDLVGIGENSHGVAAFKTVPHLLVRRLVESHGYRLLAMEGTLGDFAPVDDYVAGGDTTLDDALAALDFYFWRTEGVRRLFAWLREFNDGRPDADRVTVRGYDAQFHDANATAIRDYLDRVDPAYLSAVESDLEPLTEPRYERDGSSYLTPTQRSLVESLRERLRTKRTEYVERSSESAWRLTRRHVWTLERALRFQKHLHAEAYAEGKRVRDAAMAENVAWLRDWTGLDRAVVLGNANHTMRTDGDGPTRMGQHLTDAFGDDYYSLGLLFGTGTFAAPTNHDRTAFETYALDGPVKGTLEATLADVDHPRFFLDFQTVRENASLGPWLDDVSSVQFSVPRAAERGAVPLPASPGVVYDGVVFVRRVSPAAFVGDG